MMRGIFIVLTAVLAGCGGMVWPTEEAVLEHQDAKAGAAAKAEARAGRDRGGAVAERWRRLEGAVEALDASRIEGLALVGRIENQLGRITMLIMAGEAGAASARAAGDTAAAEKAESTVERLRVQLPLVMKNLETAQETLRETARRRAALMGELRALERTPD